MPWGLVAHANRKDMEKRGAAGRRGTQKASADTACKLFLISLFGTQPIGIVDTYLRKYPGLLLGLMAAAGLIKVGALLWQEQFSGWPLLTVLAAPLALAGLALGLGIGYDGFVSRSVAPWLAAVGGALLLAVPCALAVLGVGDGMPVAATTGAIGLALIGPWLAHPETPVGAALRAEADASTERAGA